MSDQTALKDRRTALRLSQVQLATILGVHPATIAGWEQGRRPPPTYVDLALCEVERRSKPEEREDLIDHTLEIVDSALATCLSDPKSVREFNVLHVFRDYLVDVKASRLAEPVARQRVYEITRLFSSENGATDRKRAYTVEGNYMDGIAFRHATAIARGPVSAIMDVVTCQQLPIDLAGGTSIYWDPRRYEGYPWPYVADASKVDDSHLVLVLAWERGAQRRTLTASVEES